MFKAWWNVPFCVIDGVNFSVMKHTDWWGCVLSLPYCMKILWEHHYCSLPECQLSAMYEALSALPLFLLRSRYQKQYIPQTITRRKEPDCYGYRKIFLVLQNTYKMLHWTKEEQERLRLIPVMSIYGCFLAGIYIVLFLLNVSRDVASYRG